MKENRQFLHHLFIRVEVSDFCAWYREHKHQAHARAEFGLSDGPIYRELDNPNAAMVQLNTNDLRKAIQWFKTAEFREAMVRAGVEGREFYDTAYRKIVNRNHRRALRSVK